MLEDRTAIIVTHDILDAFTLADRVIVLDAGRIIEQGAARETLERPRTAFTAGLAALNLVTGVRTGDGMVTDSGVRIVSTVATDAAIGEPVAAAIRPISVRVLTERKPTSGANRFTAVILDLEPRGDIVRVRSELISADLHPAAVADAELTTGMTVEYAFDADAVTIYATDRDGPGDHAPGVPHVGG